MVKVWMQDRTDFENSATLLNYLSEQLLRGRLCLFLGAGVSTYFRLPDWPELIRKLYASRGEVPPNDKRIERQAEYFAETYFKNDHPGFMNAIHKELYEGVDVGFDAMRGNKTLVAIGSLVMASRRGSVSDVITFNWDDLLEIYLAYHGFVAQATHEKRPWAGTCDVTVLHPHGFIPYVLARGFSESLVFDLMSYSDITGDEANPWRQRLLSIMRTHTCLFIGLSGDDADLDSLLNACSPNHACRAEHSLFWGVRFTTSQDPTDAALWEKRGIFSLAVADYVDALPDVLFQISQGAAEKWMAS